MRYGILRGVRKRSSGDKLSTSGKASIQREDECGILGGEGNWIYQSVDKKLFFIGAPVLGGGDKRSLRSGGK